MDAPPRISRGAMMTFGTVHPTAETMKPRTAAMTTGAVRPEVTERVTERKLVPCALSPAMMNGDSTAI